ncbi:MAG: hypothetical protein AAF541_18655 [Pseudomonadota bacterium]
MTASEQHDDEQIVKIEGRSIREALAQLKLRLGADAIILEQEHYPNGVIVYATNDMLAASRWGHKSDAMTDKPVQEPVDKVVVDKFVLLEDDSVPDKKLEEEVMQNLAEEGSHSRTQQKTQAQAQVKIDAQTDQDMGLDSGLELEFGVNNVDISVREPIWPSSQYLREPQPQFDVPHPLFGQANAHGYGRSYLEFYPDVADIDGLRSQLSGDVSVHEQPGSLTGRFIFQGAPGVGKTTFLIKQLLASLQLQRATDIAVVNCDTQRLGNGEALALACQVFDVDIYHCEIEALSQTLATLDHKQLVLIDTAGTHNLPALQLALSSVWVVSALLHNSYLQSQWRQMRAHKPQYVALTNLDQVPDADEMLRNLYKWRVQLLGINSDPGVTQELPCLAPQDLYKLLFDADMTPNQIQFHA